MKVDDDPFIDMDAATAPEGRAEGRSDDTDETIKAAREHFKENGNGETSSGPEGHPCGPQLISVWASDVQMKAIKWVWPGRFAFGKVGIIAGLPDEGKGQLPCYIAAQLAKENGQWPCEEGKVDEPCNIVLLSAEDDLEDTVKPRLMAAGADCSRILILNMVRETNGGKRMFSLTADLELIRAKVKEIDATVVLIDPFSAYMGKTDSFRTTAVRNVLSPLVDLASELRIAIIGIMHFNKKVDITNVLLRISDSLAFGAVARHVYGVVRDADAENDRRVLVRGKNNHARVKDKALAYTIDACVVGMSEDNPHVEIWAPCVTFEKDYVDVTAAEAMAAAANNKSPTARNEAKKFLADILSAGPVLKKTIEEAADAEGISERTLFRAKNEMKIMAKKDGKDGGWQWHLPKDKGDSK